MKTLGNHEYYEKLRSINNFDKYCIIGHMLCRIFLSEEPIWSSDHFVSNCSNCDNFDPKY